MTYLNKQFLREAAVYAMEAGEQSPSRLNEVSSVLRSACTLLPTQDREYARGCLEKAIQWNPTLANDDDVYWLTRVGLKTNGASGAADYLAKFPKGKHAADAHLTYIAGFSGRWKSMTTGSVRTLRFEGEYIYGKVVLPDGAVKAGMFFLMEVKKDGNKYIGKMNGRVLSALGGKSCSVTEPIELTLVTPERIEGRVFNPPQDAKIDWNACTYSPPADWQTFTWIHER